MKVAGFTFIRNAVALDYPIVEAITSILPLCDIVVVAVGKSDDDTLQLLQALHEPKIRLLETEWNDALREGGRVLAEETNKAFDAIPVHYDWCFYIQGDECVHEQDFPAIRAAMEQYKNDKRTEGLLFHYKHFYGSYDYTGASRRWYRREVRIIRNNKNIRSYRDAQGFRWSDGRKLQVREIPAFVYHYGWVRHPEAQQRKQLNFNKLWHSDAEVAVRVGDNQEFDYNDAEPLERFTGTHPAAMARRIAAVNWQFRTQPEKVKWSWKDRLKGAVESITGWRPGEYKNFRVI